MTTVERIHCPWGFGEKTRDQCKACSYAGYEDCPAGGFFVFRPQDRKAYEKWLVK